MIRSILNNSIHILTDNEEQVNVTAARELKQLKRRLFILFGLLFAMDCLNLVANISSNFLISDTSSSAYPLSIIITGPFYISLHLLVLFSLLDSFKGGVLRKRGNNTSTSKTEHSSEKK